MSTDWIQDLPKVELHLHLEGAIPPDALFELVRKYGSDEVESLQDLAARFTYRDFDHFIDTWVWKNSFLREYEDFTLIAEAVARSLAAQNIVYAEAFYSPPDFERFGLELGPLTEAFRTGLDRVDGVRVQLICDVVRDFGAERALRTVDAAHEARELGIIGIGLGGSEAQYPATLFEHAFERARELGFRTTAHAGEAAGAQSVRAALDVLRVERIGHGVRAIEDAALVSRLADESITLELCPTSNVCTAVVPTFDAHPFRALDEAGVPVTVNTDDPEMFNCTLAGELSGLVEHFEYTPEELVRLMTQAVEASWLEADEKEALAVRIGAKA